MCIYKIENIELDHIMIHMIYVPCHYMDRVVEWETRLHSVIFIWSLCHLGFAVIQGGCNEGSICVSNIHTSSIRLKAIFVCVCSHYATFFSNTNELKMPFNTIIV
jgi:hypothetical protein